MFFNKKIKKKIAISFSSFYQHFIGEISCFFPFFIISAVSSLKDAGSINFNGKINDTLHVLTFFIFNFITLSGLCLSFMSAQEDSKN
jgi:hypothetical protein